MPQDYTLSALFSSTFFFSFLVTRDMKSASSNPMNVVEVCCFSTLAHPLFFPDLGLNSNLAQKLHLSELARIN